LIISTFSLPSLFSMPTPAISAFIDFISRRHFRQLFSQLSSQADFSSWVFSFFLFSPFSFRRFAD
jgi:hypothetical protein